MNTLTEINTLPDSYTKPLIEQSTPELNAEAAPSREFWEFYSDHPEEALFEYQPPVSGSCFDSEAVSCDSCLSPAPSTNYLQSTDKEKERLPDQCQSSEQLPSPQALPFFSQNHKPLTTTPLENQKRISDKTHLNKQNKEKERELHDEIKCIIINTNNTCMNLLHLSPKKISSNTILPMANKCLTSVEKKSDTKKILSTTETPAEKATTSIIQPQSNKQHSLLQANSKTDCTEKYRKEYMKNISNLKKQLSLTETTTIIETLKDTVKALIKNQRELKDNPLYFSDILDFHNQ